MKNDFEKLSDEEIIEIARKELPLPSEVRIEEFVIPLISDSINIPPYMQKQPKPVTHVKIIQVFFRKTYISGLAVGWEFKSLTKPEV